MKMASYWLLEEQLVHKLFKVLVPRYRNSQQSYTKMWKVSVSKPTTLQKTVLELRNNIYPPLGEVKTNNKNLSENKVINFFIQKKNKNKVGKSILKFMCGCIHMHRLVL